MKLFECQYCGQLPYFENRQCQRCFHRLGYLAGGRSSLCGRERRSCVAGARLLTGRFRFCAKHGLMFDFLANPADPGGHGVVTGHEDGLIAINLAEADDAEREKLRLAMGETYGTLLGHLRHEAGHTAQRKTGNKSCQRLRGRPSLGRFR